MSAGALDGIKIVELGQMVSAPYCAKLFADFGAEVIKVESPAGDVARQWGPFPEDEPHPEKSGLYLFMNTSKQSVTLDLSDKRGRELFLALIADTDAVIENNLPKQMREWKLTYDDLAAANPDLVMISITPFGQSGPYSEWNGYDLNAYHLTGASDRYCGKPGEAPLEHGTFSADYFGAVAAASWGLAAIYGRDNAGGGQHIDVSCAEAIAAAFVGGQNIGAVAQDGNFDKRTGVGMSLGAPATILPCKDGHAWILCLETAQWNGLAKTMGDPEWMQLELFQDMFSRAQNSDAMYPLIEQWTTENGKMDIMDRCQANGVPVSAVFTVGEAAEHEHLQGRGYIVEQNHPAAGTIRNLGAPFRMPASPGGPRSAAPLLGANNDEVFAGLGKSSDQISQLRSDGVI